MRKLVLAAALAGTAASAALAQSNDEPVSGYMVCTIIEQISRPFPVAEGATRGDLQRVIGQWQDAAQRWHGGRCFIGSRAEMEDEFATQVRKITAALGTPGIIDFKPNWKYIIRSPRRNRTSEESTDASKPPRNDANAGAGMSSTTEKPFDEAARKAEREARKREKEAKYQAELAAWNATIEAQKQAEARKQAAHAANRADADRAKAAFAARMEAHRATLAANNARQQEYFAAQRRHALCVNGDKQACADIAAGKPAMGDKLADAGNASTDTEATTCVSRPVITANATFAGNTAATVANGCATAVDVRICLMREGGWNCGVKWGLRPQERWSHSSFKASGEIFWDARVSGSQEPLASPGGSN